MPSDILNVLGEYGLDESEDWVLGILVYYFRKLNSSLAELDVWIWKLGHKMAA